MGPIWAMISKSLSRCRTVIRPVRQWQPDQVVVLCTAKAERNGQPWSSPEVHIWRVAGNQVMDFCGFQGRRVSGGRIVEFRGLSPVKFQLLARAYPGSAKPVVLRVPRWRNAFTSGSAHSVHRCW
jgi:hypothetical protein